MEDLIPEDARAIDGRAAVLNAPGIHFDVEAVAVEAPRADEIRVRLVATGICHTDIAMAGGGAPIPFPVVLGHEGAGIVEAVGSAVTTHAVGDHVVLSFAHCGACPSCLEGAPSYCIEFMRRNFACARPDGSSSIGGGHPIHSHFFGQSSLATHTICAPRNAVIVAKDAPLELLGPLGCGVQTGAGAVMIALQVQAGASIAVFGTGAVGLSAIMAARIVGATTIVAVDRNQARLDLAAELGATHLVLAAEDGTEAAIRRIAPAGLGFTLDTTGIDAVMSTAVAVLALRGKCGLVAGGPAVQTVIRPNFLFSGGRSIVGITEGGAVPATFIPLLVDLHLQGKLPFERMVHFFDLEDIDLAVAKAQNGEVVKPIICF